MNIREQTLGSSAIQERGKIKNKKLFFSTFSRNPLPSLRDERELLPKLAHPQLSKKMQSVRCGQLTWEMCVICQNGHLSKRRRLHACTGEKYNRSVDEGSFHLLFHIIA